MRLTIIRHGDPDYEHDTLTPQGREEALLLAPRAAAWKDDEIFVSPLGRAELTARLALGVPEEAPLPWPTLDWLREFDAKIHRPDKPGMEKIAWDWLPTDWMADERHFTRDQWMETPVFAASNVKERYGRVCRELDALLARYGYVRDTGKRDIPLYHVKTENRVNLVFFCHFGLTCVLLSHLIGAPPMVLWHGLCSAPTSVTEVRTEERRAGAASFRISSFGDCSHLYAAGREPSPHARFAEIFSASEERHD